MEQQQLEALIAIIKGGVLYTAQLLYPGYCGLCEKLGITPLAVEELLAPGPVGAPPAAAETSSSAGAGGGGAGGASSATPKRKEESVTETAPPGKKARVFGDESDESGDESDDEFGINALVKDAKEITPPEDDEDEDDEDAEDDEDDDDGALDDKMDVDADKALDDKIAAQALVEAEAHEARIVALKQKAAAEAAAAADPSSTLTLTDVSEYGKNVVIVDREADCGDTLTTDGEAALRVSTAALDADQTHMEVEGQAAGDGHAYVDDGTKFCVDDRAKKEKATAVEAAKNVALKAFAVEIIAPVDKDFSPDQRVTRTRAGNPPPIMPPHNVQGRSLVALSAKEQKRAATARKAIIDANAACAAAKEVYDDAVLAEDNVPLSDTTKLIAAQGVVAAALALLREKETKVREALAALEAVLDSTGHDDDMVAEVESALAEVDREVDGDDGTIHLVYVSSSCACGAIFPGIVCMECGEHVCIFCSFFPYQKTDAVKASTDAERWLCGLVKTAADRTLAAVKHSTSQTVRSRLCPLYAEFGLGDVETPCPSAKDAKIIFRRVFGSLLCRDVETPDGLLMQFLGSKNVYCGSCALHACSDFTVGAGDVLSAAYDDCSSSDDDDDDDDSSDEDVSLGDLKAEKERRAERKRKAKRHSYASLKAAAQKRARSESDLESKYQEARSAMWKVVERTIEEMVEAALNSQTEEDATNAARKAQLAARGVPTHPAPKPTPKSSSSSSSSSSAGGGGGGRAGTSGAAKSKAVSVKAQPVRRLLSEEQLAAREAWKASMKWVPKS